MSESNYSVCQFFEDGTHDYELRFVTAETAVIRALQMVQSVGGRLGTTQRIIITDGGDMIVWEWKWGEGVVFPPPESVEDKDEG